jgi:glutamate--cysteine ligase
MTSRYRVLSKDDVRRELSLGAFSLAADGPRGGAGFGAELQLFPLHWRRDGASAPRIEKSGGAAFEALAMCANELGFALVEPCDQDFEVNAACDRAELRILSGRRIALRTAMHPGPANAANELERAFDLIRAALASHGVMLVSAGLHPLLTPRDVQLESPSTTERCRAMSPASEALGLARDACACATVRIGFGGPLRLPLRWRAAQLLAPIATAMFASSPFVAGVHVGAKSVRARARRFAQHGRYGFPRRLASELDADPLEVWLEFALDAPVDIVRLPDRWLPTTRPMSFAHWMQHGFSGHWPDLDDFRQHLFSLEPEVRPRECFELASADAMPRAFATVPLTWWTALLCDDGALSTVLDRLSPSARELDSRWDRAARDGLGDPELGRDARELYALAAQTLLRFERGFTSPAMLAAFVTYGRIFTQRGRAPADERLEQFLQHAGLSADAWTALERRWCEAVARA